MGILNTRQTVGGLVVLAALFALPGCDLPGREDPCTRTAALKGQDPVMLGVQKFVAKDGHAVAQLGYAVAVSGDTALVGAREDDDRGPAAGAVYVLQRKGGAWKQQQKLTAAGCKGICRFGGSVALEGDTALVGAEYSSERGNSSGSAYLFARKGGIWKQQQRLTAFDGAGHDYFGVDVALSGNDALVGACGDSDRANQAGALYLYRRSGSTWKHKQKLTAANGLAWDLLGTRVALDKDTVVAGIPSLTGVGWPGKSQGLAYVFSRSGGIWSQSARITAPPGALHHAMGADVAVAGDMALVGDPSFSIRKDHFEGAAYVFARSGKSWKQQAILTASDGALGDKIGARVALIEGTALVGSANFHPGFGGGPKLGAAYLFQRDGLRWSQKLKLTAPGGKAEDDICSGLALGETAAVIGASQDSTKGKWAGAAYLFDLCGETQTGPLKPGAKISGKAAYDGLGDSVSISGDRAVVGVAGAEKVTVQVASGKQWKQEAELKAADGAPKDEFGEAAAIHGQTILVGAIGDDDRGSHSGSAYVFSLGSKGWTQQAKLTAADGVSGDQLGGAVAIHGNTALVGAASDDSPGGIGSGSAYFFVRSGQTWIHQAKLTAPGGGYLAGFGWALAMDDSHALVGSPGHKTAGAHSGAAFLYGRTGSSWSLEAKLTASDAAKEDSFGWSVSLSGNMAAVGAVGKAGAESGAGAAYIFTRSGAGWSEQQKLTAAKPGVQQNFGSAVALRGASLLVGVWGDDQRGHRAGAAYQYARSGTVWSQVLKLTAHDGAGMDEFGYALALGQGKALIGAPGVDGNGHDVGSAYFFSGAVSCVSDKPDAGPPDSRVPDATGLDNGAPDSLPPDAGPGTADMGAPGIVERGCHCNLGHPGGAQVPFLWLILLIYALRWRNRRK